MSWHLQVLGCNAAIPSFERFASAQILLMDGESFLFDCGEGTQLQIRRFRIKWMKIRRIFISHCHGDHLFGLPGLLTSLALAGRTQPLSIYGPVGIKHFINAALATSGATLKYPLKINEHTAVEGCEILKTDKVKVSTVPLKHRIPTTGYVVEEVLPPRKLLPQALDQYKVPFADRDQLKHGKDFKQADKTVANELLTEANRDPCRFGYCTDTAYHPSIIGSVAQVDLLYHEATFAHDLAHLAAGRGHSTSIEAAKIALAAQAKKLLIGHYSSRYDDLNVLLEEAKTVFPNTILAKDGLVIPLK